MGGFINSQSDAEICEVLNKRFSDDLNANGQTYLDELRGFFQTEKLFDANHKLNRVFHRLAISVTGGASVPKNKHSRLRWFHLLKGNKLPAAVETAIRDQLTHILSPASSANPAGGVDYVTFSTVHQSTANTTGAQFELIDNSDPANVNLSQPIPIGDANGKSYCALILRCNVDKPLDDAPGENDPPQSDGNNVEKGPIPFVKPKPKKPPRKRYPAKKTAVKKKKAAKKVSKKGKKAAKKRR